ncbi:GTP-binding protein [Streptomyces sp. AA1529]|uniref:GTP-binding protein n=1 Tax=Streptomyces sp. AA1529 TaxID=1203257 RepID=UPI0002E17ECF|nr:GTP-binding protein [Streptomyces sp. AA1529]
MTDRSDNVDASVNVVVLGHVDHGKTMLATAISRVCAEVYGGEAVDFSTVDTAAAQKEPVPFEAAVVECDSNKRRYALTDFPSHGDLTKAMLQRDPYDAAILVVSAADGPMPQSSEHVLFAHQTGIPHILVFLNKADLVDDGELVDAVELEVRDLLATYDYPGDRCTVIVGSARQASEGVDHNEMGISAVRKLVEALDTEVPDRAAQSRPQPAVASRFIGEVYLLSAEEGGRTTPLPADPSLQLAFPAGDGAGTGELPQGLSSAMPGDNFQMTITLSRPVAMAQGTRFQIREDGRTIGIGVVAKALD